MIQVTYLRLADPQPPTQVRINRLKMRPPLLPLPANLSNHIVPIGAVFRRNLLPGRRWPTDPGTGTTHLHATLRPVGYRGYLAHRLHRFETIEIVHLNQFLLTLRTLGQFAFVYNRGPP